MYFAYVFMQLKKRKHYPVQLFPSRQTTAALVSELADINWGLLSYSPPNTGQQLHLAAASAVSHCTREGTAPGAGASLSARR